MATQDEPTTQNEQSVDESAEVPAKAPRRRRATKKAAAPAPAEVATDSAAGDAVADAAAEAGGEPAPEAQEGAEDAAPKKKAARKTAKKAPAKAAKKTTRAKKTAEPEPEPEAEPETLLDLTTPVEEPTEDEAEETEEAPAAPAAPSFGLIFQAPDVSKAPRRRRATAPAQAPSEGTIDRAADRTPDQDEAAPDEAAVSEVQSTPDRPTRSRRGGRATQKADVLDSAEDAQPLEDEDTDETSHDDSSDEPSEGGRRRRRGGRGRRGRGGNDRSDSHDTDDTDDSSGDASRQADSSDANDDQHDDADTSGRADDSADSDSEGGSSRRRRRRRRSGSSGDSDDPPGTVTRVREPRKERERSDEPTAVKGSTRLEAKKQRRREGREAGRRRTIITEAEFLARRESVERVMAVRGKGDKTQIGVLEDGVLVEHYVSRETNASMAGNVYLGRVQNVLPSMEAAFVDIGKGRNAVLYAGEVNWDAAGLEQNKAKRIENALGSGDTVLVQVTKDPIGHKGARLTSQISLPGRYLVYVPEGSMTGISRKLPDTERARLKAILKEVVPDHAGVIVRTAAEGASEEELRADVERLTKAWDTIQQKVKTAGSKKGGAPVLLHGEADLTVRVIRDVFTEDFSELIVSGDQAWSEVSGYVEDVAPDLAKRLTHWTSEEDLFTHHRVDEQIAKAMDRKVWLPSGGSLVIDRTEAMTVVDVNTGKFVGSGGNLEETVTKNNIEAAEEIVRQLRLRDIGGIIVIDFIDMVLESNRDLVVRRLLECLGRDRTKHQVAEVTSLGLVQMTRKRVGSGLIEVFSEQCEHCDGRGIIVQSDPIDRSGSNNEHGHGSNDKGNASGRSRSRRGKVVESGQVQPFTEAPSTGSPAVPNGPTAAQIAAAAHAAAIKSMSGEPTDDDVAELTGPPADAATQPGQGFAADAEQGRAADATSEPDAASEPETAPEPDTAPGPDTAAESTTVPTATVIAEVGQPDSQDVEPMPQLVRTPAPIDEPVVRPRRKRGRVVAPAGPPKSVDLEQGDTDR
ncbi:Rne/Rng family ribonuclease [Knoellia sp. Soil729]|uniref:Rne/Rng family ribonuclease n=1 Tax=Knoellia sp. Soil729 TaxID=1736394 RepID=UPI000700884B|nr:Rne/Rng family ribonuclease [Knoellia sp. Soil729]KRE41849.1 ribonuclease [Knoellia sp. Soil729]